MTMTNTTPWVNFWMPSADPSTWTVKSIQNCVYVELREGKKKGVGQFVTVYVCHTLREGKHLGVARINREYVPGVVSSTLDEQDELVYRFEALATRWSA